MVLALVARGLALLAPRILPVVGRFATTILSSPLKALGIATGVGVLTSSPIARGFVVDRLTDPLGAGRRIGGAIETASLIKETEARVQRVPQSLVPNITLISGIPATATPSGQFLRSERLTATEIIKTAVAKTPTSTKIALAGATLGALGLVGGGLLAKGREKVIDFVPQPSPTLQTAPTAIERQEILGETKVEVAPKKPTVKRRRAKKTPPINIINQNQIFIN